MPEPARSSVLSSVVDAALNINRPRPRAQTLALLAPFLDGPRRSTLLDSALQASYAIEELAARADVLAALIPQLPIDSQPTVVAVAVEAAVAIRAPALVRSLSAISPFLSPAMLADMIDKAKAIRQ